MKKRLFLWGTIIVLVVLTTTVFANEVRYLAAYVVQFRVMVDGVEQHFADPIVVINDRTYVPLRAVSEALGMDVEWCGENQQISMSSIPQVIPPAMSHRPENVQALYGDDTLHRFEQNGFWGLMDVDGNVLVAPQFLFISRWYSEGLVSVLGVSGDEGHWGFIDREGNLAISLPRIAGVERAFSEGFAIIRPRNWGMADRPLAVVDTPGPLAFINRNGHEVFGQEFELASDFRDGLAVVIPYRGPYSGMFFIDTTGQNAFGKVFGFASDFVDGYASVRLLDGTDTHIDREGNIVDRPSR